MPRSGKAAFSDHLIFFPAVVTRGGRTTSGRGIAQCFSGRFPRLSGWFHGQYKRPTLCCRDAGLLYTLRACVCVCVRERERERERVCAPRTLCGGGGPSLCLREHASASLSREMDC